MMKTKFQMPPTIVMVFMVVMMWGLSACDKEKEEPDYTAFNIAQKDLNTELYSNSEPDYSDPYNIDIIYYSTNITYEPFSMITGGPVAVFAYDTESLPTLYTCSYQHRPYQISALGATLTITDVTNIHSAKMRVIWGNTDKEEIKEYYENLKLEGIEFSKIETVNGNFYNEDAEYITLNQNGGDVEGFGKIEKTANNQIRLTVDRNTGAGDCYFLIDLSYSKKVENVFNGGDPFFPKFRLYFKRLGLKTE